MRRIVMLTAVVLMLAACTPEPVDPAFDETAGGVLLAQYEAARADSDWETAEMYADELRSEHGETEAASKMRATLADVQEKAGAEREARRLKDLWTYQKFAVDGGTQYSASLDSRVEHDPESGTPRPAPDATLIFRRHPDWGESAYLVLAQESLRCGPPCTLKIRFDDGQPESFAGDPADTGTGPALFIVDRDRFLDRLADARQVRIYLPATEHLAPMFEFEVGGFDRKRHLAD